MTSFVLIKIIYKNYFYLLIVVFLCILLVHDPTSLLAFILLSCINKGCMYVGISSYFKGARSRFFGQFQHSSNGHRINWTIKITTQDYRRTPTKHRPAKKIHGWTKLERIKMDCFWVNLKNVGPPFFKFISVYIKMSFTQLENHSQLLYGRDLVNERILICEFDV